MTIPHAPGQSTALLSYSVVSIAGSVYAHLALGVGPTAPEHTSCGAVVVPGVFTHGDLCPACLDAEVAAGRISRP